MDETRPRRVPKAPMQRVVGRAFLPISAPGTVLLPSGIVLERLEAWNNSKDSSMLMVQYGIGGGDRQGLMFSLKPGQQNISLDSVHFQQSVRVDIRVEPEIDVDLMLVYRLER